jgi:small subunit ribosomal protein S1
VIRGPIKNITDFGVFVGVEEGIDGFVHVSDLSWSGRISHPGEMFEEDLEVEAVVLNIDVEQGRFSLGIKQLTDDPWRPVPDDWLEPDTVVEPEGPDRKAIGGGSMPDWLEPDTEVDVRALEVTREEVLVELAPGIEAILPGREWSSELTDLTTVVRPGEEIRVVLYDVDILARTIYVSRVRAQ